MNRYCGVAVLLATIGCGGESDTVPVRGLIRLDGQPLKDASVQFVPEATGRDATGTTDEEGHFVLSTFEPRDGALPGTYKVVVTPNAPIEETPEGMSAEQAMAAASAAAALAPKKPAGLGVPQQYTRADKTPLKQSVPSQGDVVIELKSK